MKNRGFYSKILAMSMLLGQATPVAQALNTESNIPGMYTANPFADLMDTQDKVDTSGDSVVKNDENDTEKKEAEIGTTKNQGESKPGTVEVDIMTMDASESETLFDEADTSWYDAKETDFTIETAEELLGFSQLVSQGNSFDGKTVILGDDIDLAELDSNWVPIGNDGTNQQEFKGTFDGNQKEISNLTINDSSAKQQGLFYYVDSGAVVKNVILTDVDISAHSIVGGIASLNYGTIQNCAVSGRIEAEDVTSGQGSCVGGLVGKNNGNGSIINCFNWSDVTGVTKVGGIAGLTETQTTLANVYNVGTVNATDSDTPYSGSLVGYNDGAISYSYWLGADVSATGNSYKLLTNCYSFDEDGDLNDVEEDESDEEESDKDESDEEESDEEESDEDESNEEESDEDESDEDESDEDESDEDESDEDESDDESKVEQETAGVVYVLPSDTDPNLVNYMNAWVEAQGVSAGNYTWQQEDSNDFPSFYQAYTHSWVLEITEADGDTEGYITATCSNSGDEITLTLQKDLTYLGEEFGFWDLFSAKIQSDDESLSLKDFDLEEIFADLVYDTVYNAGEYTISMADIDEEITFSVEEAPITVTWTPNSFKFLEETAQIPTATATGLVGEDAEKEIELKITFEASDDGDDASISVGSYTATARLENFTENYVIAEGESHDYTINELDVITVNFYSNGVIFDTQTITELDEDKTVSAPTDPDRGETFRFDGWYTSEAYNSPYNFSSNVNGDMNLYAKWSELFTVTFDYNDDGVTAGSSTTVWEGDKLEKPSPDPTRGNDVFAGWYNRTDAGGLGTAYNFESTVSGNLSLIANWNVIYTATFYHNDEENTTTTQQSLSGTTLTAPSNPTRENYVFGGWYQDETCETVWNFTNHTLNEDINLYAKWTRQYTITFDSQGGSSVISKKALEGGLCTEPGEPGWTDYYFMGWYTDETFTTQWNFTSDLVYHDMTLYALWEAFPAFSVNFETNGGSAIETQIILAECPVEQPVDPILSGYEFQGWYSDSELLLPWDFENDIVTKAMTLYAKWEKIVYLTYGHVYSHDGNGMLGTQVYLYQNGKLLANSQADSNGYFTFGDLAEGVYNLEYSIGTKTLTTAVEVFYQEHQEIADVYMPEYTVKSTVSISSQTSIHAVSGLYETTNYLTASQGYYDTYSINLSVSNYVNGQETALIENVMSPYDRIIEYFDVSITTDKNSLGDNNLLGTSNLIQIVMEIPWQYRNNDIFKVYRLHNDNLDVLTTTPNAIGEYVEVSYDGKFISIFTKNFSTYALAYTAENKLDTDFEAGEQNGSSETRIYDISTRFRLNGNESTETIMGGVSYSTSFPVYGTTVVVMPQVNYGYEVDYVTAVSEAGESLQVTRSNDGNYRFVQGLSPVTVTVAYVSSRVQTNTQQFSDVFPGDSYFDAVNRVVDAGLMTGTGNGIFSPHSTITRGMLVTILYNLSGEVHDGTAQFWDVNPSDYFATAVAWAQENDVVMGYEDRTFRPNQGITREEIAAIYYSYANYTNTLENSWVYPTEFTDNAQIGGWARTAVAWCVNQDILDARFDNLFFPQAFGTRAEVAVSLLPML